MFVQEIFQHAFQIKSDTLTNNYHWSEKGLPI